MKKILFICTISLLVFIIFGCTEEQSNVVNYENNLNLGKIISPSYNWTTYSYWDDFYHIWVTQSTSTYSFTFMNYNYNLGYSRISNFNGTYTNSVVVKVNETYCHTVTWINSDPAGNETGLLPTSWFTYNGVGMGIQLNVLEFYLPMYSFSEPRQVKIVIQDGR